uniref:Uncharacterized protein n=1 Tax=Fagus sylvatica TaxID=28930 RepID=A0A2N9F9I6_FAGSY
MAKRERSLSWVVDGKSYPANGEVPGVELRPQCGWVSCGEDLISLSFSLLFESVSAESVELWPNGF